MIRLQNKQFQILVLDTTYFYMYMQLGDAS